MGGNNMSEQKVVRTNASNSSTYRLKTLLNDGYTVAHATKLSGDVIEYIVEREGAKEFVYDQEEAIEFILSTMGDNVYPEFVRVILNKEEEYMRSKGIIED